MTAIETKTAKALMPEYDSPGRTRIDILKENLAGCDRTLANLEADRRYFQQRLDEIPGNMVAVEEWKRIVAKELEILEGNGADNGHLDSGHLISAPIPEASSNHH